MSSHRNSRKEQESDEALLQALLAESQRRMENQQRTDASDKNDNPTGSKASEVLYNDGATPLFNAIEETRWTDALDLLEVVPEQASIWVASTGTENTTFGWTLWRRLPIHEACRRQAPAWLVAALLKAAPFSIQATTQFGELPLHLAVEMGATPEVINLLLVNYYPGIHVPDNSGRTPMQIHLQGDVAYHVEDHKYIQESLKNAHETLVQMEAMWQCRLDEQSAQHEVQIQKLKASHDDEIQMEKEKLWNLQKYLSQVEGYVQQYREERKALERTLSSHHVEKGTWREILETKKGTVEELVNKLEGQDVKVAELKSKLQNKSDECLSLVGRVVMLEDDLRNITVLQQDDVAASVQQLEIDFQRMLMSHATLGGKLHGHCQGLNMLLEARGISLPSRQPPLESVEVPEVNMDYDNMAMEDVSAAAAKAAMAAINKAEVEVYEKLVLTELEDEVLHQESNLNHTVLSEEKKDV